MIWCARVCVSDDQPNMICAVVAAELVAIKQEINRVLGVKADSVSSSRNTIRRRT